METKNKETEVRIRSGNGEYFEHAGDIVIECGDGACDTLDGILRKSREMESRITALERRCDELSKSLDKIRTGVKEIASNMISVNSDMAKDISEMQYQISQIQEGK